MAEHDSPTPLEAENARLIALLEANNIEWRLPPKTESLISTSEEVEMMMPHPLFRPRHDELQKIPLVEFCQTRLS